MREAGFSNVSLFYASFTFRGWVGYAWCDLTLSLSGASPDCPQPCASRSRGDQSAPSTQIAWDHSAEGAFARPFWAV